MSQKLPAGHFFGKPRGSVQIENARLTESIYAGGAELKNHSHELPHVGLIVDGTYVESIGRKSQTVLPGTLTFYHPRQDHSERFLTPGIHFLIEIHPKDPSLADAMMPLFDAERVSRGSDLAVAWRLYREFKGSDCFSDLVMESLTLELLVESFRCHLSVRENHRPKWMNKVIEILRTRFSETPRLTEIARQAGVHPVHLAKSFRRFEGMTIGDYLRKLRIDFAREKLVQTSDPISQVALDAGFSDQTHFTRVFKRIIGTTPHRYRTLIRS